MASVLVVPTALAEVSIYGVAAPAIEYSEISASAGRGLARIRLVDNVSRIGFKGSEKLDSGVKLNWQVESRAYTGSGDFVQLTNGFATRDSFVGVEGKFGSAVVGTAINDLIYRSKVDYLNGLVAFNETVNGVHKSVNQSEGRLLNIAHYRSPTFLGGAQVQVMYDFGAKNATADYRGIQALAMYRTKTFKVGGAYKQNWDTDTAGTTVVKTQTPTAGSYLKSYVLGATVTPISNLDVSAMAVWTKRQKGPLSSAEKCQNGWAVGANYAVGKHGMGLHYGVIGDREDAGTVTADTGAQFLAAQYKFALSKQTFLHVSYGLTKNDANAKYSMGTTKVADSSNTDPIKAGINGMKVSTITAGVTTRF